MPPAERPSGYHGRNSVAGGIEVAHPGLGGALDELLVDPPHDIELAAVWDRR
jgi:hypothetical protein